MLFARARPPLSLTLPRPRQLIGSRPDLFPEPYTRKLAPLQDACPAMDGALLVRVVETELLGGAPLSAVFSAFDATPLGSASVAQVHRAVLRATGEAVAVKVQRPGMEALSARPPPIRL